ncbi:DUF4259 domain-containing protein [Kitasatospora sp. NPDC101157]|uniref:DUF4259 domain-containing protein n=1 Tax=Kitasatospora sp. NPDC101157 TaxID=3364098 RepID=UPI00380C47DD
MGTWDIGHFDNDTAADFAGDLDGAAPDERPVLLRAALERAARRPEHLDDDVDVEAVAAAGSRAGPGSGRALARGRSGGGALRRRGGGAGARRGPAARRLSER